MDENKKEFVKMYDDKLKNLQDRLDAERTNMAGKNQEVRELSTKVVALTSKNSLLNPSTTVQIFLSDKYDLNEFYALSFIGLRIKRLESSAIY